MAADIGGCGDRGRHSPSRLRSQAGLADGGSDAGFVREVAAVADLRSPPCGRARDCDPGSPSPGRGTITERVVRGPVDNFSNAPVPEPQPLKGKEERAAQTDVEGFTRIPYQF